MAQPAIGNMLTPAGFAVQSAQGQVISSWQISPLATTYYVNRSTDNVTFASLGQTSSLQYVDSTAVVGTIYYYTVQAANSSASSLATASLAGEALKPGQTTVGNLDTEIRQRCNKENSPFITQQESYSMINQSFKELYDILVSKWGQDYKVAQPYSFTTDGSSSLFPLPADLYELMGVEVALNPSDPNSWVTLKKFEFIQRNLWNYPNVYTFYGITNLRYRLNGDNLYIVPICSANQTIRIWYAPRPNQLINSTDTVDAISGWEEYIVADCCVKILAKEESDPSIFIAQKNALLERIESMAQARDIGEPETVSDSKLRNFAWSDDGGMGGGNGGMW
jgi:hypothetical protein